MKQKSILRMHDVHKQFKQGNNSIIVLEGITAHFEEGGTYALTGSSGSGKSTMLYALGGLEKPSAGKVYWQDQDVYAMSNKDFFHNQVVGFVFQFHYLVKELTVLKNIMLMGMIKGLNNEECHDRAYTLLKKVGLESRAHHYPTQLSGGEQQRVAIMRALFNKPAFLLADEPTGSLDNYNADVIIDLFLQMQAEFSTGLIVCSHDRHIYTKMNTIYNLHNGRLAIAKSV